MSLQLAAKHLAAHGRGPDNTLVHMTPKEVESLQALAMRHGGSLTINPQTGLPEAGFLSSILPLVAGVGLTAMGMPAGLAALSVGGGTAVVTGDLKKGLSAGLGAYGGANLATSLIGAGAGAAPAAAAANAVPVETAASIAAAPPIPVETIPVDSSAALADPFKSYGTDPLKGFTPKELADAEFSNRQIQLRQAQLAGNPIGVKPPEMYTKGAYLPSGAAPQPSVGTLKPMAPGVVSPTVTPEAMSRAQLSDLSNANNATPGGPMRGLSIAETEYPKEVATPPEVVARKGTMDSYGTGAGYLKPPLAPPSRLESMTAGERFDALKAGATKENLWKYAKENPFETAGMLAGPLMGAYEDYRDANKAPEAKEDSDRGAMANAGYQFDPGWTNPTPRADPYGREQTYNRPRYYVPKKAADGGMMQHFDEGGTVASASQSPVLQQFIDSQAAKAAQPAPAQIDVKQQFADYLKTQSAPLQNTNPAESATAATMPSAGAMPEYWANARGDNGGGQDGGFMNSGGHSNREAGGVEGYGGIGDPNSYTNGAVHSFLNPTQNNAPVVNLSGAAVDGDTSGGYADSARNAGGDGDARGGYLDHGKFDQRYANGGGITALAQGGTYNLGSYSDGGRLLRGPGDGVSDSIPAVIGQKQPARLADGEFVVPARIVSEIGNGSTEAGARKLYAMMDRVQKSRGKTVGKGKVAKNTRADKYLPA